MLKKLFLLFVVLFAATVLYAAEQTTGLIFVGKIQDIASKTALMPTATEKYLAIRLDSKPNLDFRLTAADAAKFGLIEAKGPSAVITPGRVKGLGWKVRLTCNKQVTLSDSILMVTNLERLE